MKKSMNETIDEILKGHPELDRKSLELFYKISEMKWSAEDAYKAFAHIKVDSTRD